MNRARRILRMKPDQSGYLLEVPLILMFSAVLLAAILPRLSPVAAAVTAVLGACVILPCLHYMFLTPGWQPEAHRMSRGKSLFFFVVACIVVLGAVTLFVLRALG